MNLLISLDPGSSMTKVVYQAFSDKFFEVDILCMEPEVIKVDKESIELYESNKVTSISPENEAWIQLDQEFYAVGFLAQKFFDAQSNLKALKYESAIIKVLGVVGTIAVKLGLTPQLNLSLALLLPYGEWTDKKRLEVALTQALSNFHFRGQEFNVNLKVFNCMPEGGGLILVQNKKLGSDFFNSKNIGVLMLGYRDISSVVFEKGLSSGSSDKYGLTWMLKKIKDSTSGQSLSQLVKPVHTSGRVPKERYLKNLARSRRADFRAQEVELLVKATSQARELYWNKVCEWISVKFPRELDLIIIGGGTSKYLSKELKTYFSKTRISWAGELEQDVILAFGLSPKKDEMPLRFTDVYGLYLYLKNTTENSISEFTKEG
ncbi:MAG: ParM/StbA family protein [Mastigocoleus sp. MO_167.B18]|nr:ParM/StbA family protein [Mastigocoleus sp. MO_167.B18]